MMRLFPRLRKEDRKRLKLLVVAHKNKIGGGPAKEDWDGSLEDAAGLVDNAKINLEVFDQGDGELVPSKLLDHSN